MFKTISYVILACSFGFFFLGIISYLISPDLLDETEIRYQAEEFVPEVQPPPRPAGQTVTEQTTQQVCTKVPMFRGLQVVMQDKCFEQPGPQIEKFVGPTDDEMRAWETKVEQLQKERIALLELKVSQIENDQRSIFTGYTKDIIQIGSGIFGMLFGAIGALIAIRQDRREASAENTRNS